MYSRLRRHPMFKTIYRLATRLPLLLCRTPFSKSQLCRIPFFKSRLCRLPFSKSRLCLPFFAKSRICKFLIPHLFRLSQTLVSNYLLPTVRGLAFVGWQLLRSQILPRLLAAVIALVQSPLSRSQQREITIIVLPVIFLTPPTSPSTDSQPVSGTDGPDLASRPMNPKSRTSR